MTPTSLLRAGSNGDPVDASPRRAWHRLDPRAWLAAAVAIAVLLGALVFFSPVLGARTVTVSGTSHLTAAQVRSAAHIGSGTPLLRLDTSAVARRIEALPEVASAKVRTELPSTVHITVVERAPRGYLPEGAGFALVDATGDQFAVQRARPVHLPEFVVPAGADAAARATGRAVVSVAAALPDSVLGQVASIQALDPGAITLVLTDRRVVQWGSSERNADKARILPALLGQPGSRFDLSDPDQAYAH